MLLRGLGEPEDMVQIDGGADLSVVNDLSLLHHYRKAEPEFTLCDFSGNVIEGIEGYGFLIIDFNGHHVSTICWYSPLTQSNIVADGKLNEKGSELRLTNQDPLEYALTYKNESIELLTLNLSKYLSYDHIIRSKPILKICDIHTKLGHINGRYILKAARENKIVGVSESDIQRLNEYLTVDDCDCCLIGKARRSNAVEGSRDPYLHHKPFNVVYSDICQVRELKHNERAVYFVSFKCAITGFVKIYAMKKKEETYDYLVTFVSWVENQFGARDCKVKKIFSDQGKEYLSERVREFLKQRGIETHTTSAYTPASNGVAERVNLTILNDVRAMLLSSKLPPFFWIEAAHYAVFFRNHMWNPKIKNSPAGELGYAPLDINRIYEFGEKCFVKILPEGSKTGPRAYTAIHMGYSDTTYGYRTFIPTEGSGLTEGIFLETRHVTFLKTPTLYMGNTEIEEDHLETMLDSPIHSDMEEDYPGYIPTCKLDDILYDITHPYQTDSSNQYESIDESMDIDDPDDEDYQIPIRIREQDFKESELDLQETATMQAELREDARALPEEMSEEELNLYRAKMEFEDQLTASLSTRDNGQPIQVGDNEHKTHTSFLSVGNTEGNTHSTPESAVATKLDSDCGNTKEPPKSFPNDTSTYSRSMAGAPQTFETPPISSQSQSTNQQIANADKGHNLAKKNKVADQGTRLNDSQSKQKRQSKKSTLQAKIDDGKEKAQSDTPSPKPVTTPVEAPLTKPITPPPNSEESSPHLTQTASATAPKATRKTRSKGPVTEQLDDSVLDRKKPTKKDGSQKLTNSVDQSTKESDDLAVGPSSSSQTLTIEQKSHNDRPELEAIYASTFSDDDEDDADYQDATEGYDDDDDADNFSDPDNEYSYGEAIEVEEYHIPYTTQQSTEPEDPEILRALDASLAEYFIDEPLPSEDTGLDQSHPTSEETSAHSNLENELAHKFKLNRKKPNKLSAKTGDKMTTRQTRSKTAAGRIHKDYKVKSVTLHILSTTSVPIPTNISRFPKTYKAALQRPDKDAWIKAAEGELNSLTGMKTWTLTPEIVPIDSPKLKLTIPTKWVFTIKGDGTYKGRVVARGDQQKHSTFDQTYSPTLRAEIARTILALSATRRWYTKQFDFKTAYLNSKLDQEIYIYPPDGYPTVSHPLNTRVIYKLNRGIYGLKQAGRLWHLELSKTLKKLGYVKHDAFPSTFILKKDNKVICMIGLFVDDMIVSAQHPDTLTTLSKELSKVYKLKEISCDEDGMQRFLGMNLWITTTEKGKTSQIRFNQEEYIKDIIAKYNVRKNVKIQTPLPPGYYVDEEKYKGKLFATENALKIAKKEYKKRIGTLLYLSVMTRPDITYAVNYLAKFCEFPHPDLFTLIQRVFEYLFNTMDLSLVYKPKEEKGLVIYTDSDYAQDINSRRSMNGYTIRVNACTVYWKSKSTDLVCTSSTEAELQAIFIATNEGIWFRQLLVFLGCYDRKSKAHFLVDNNSIVQSIINDSFSQARKHYAVRLASVKDRLTLPDVHDIFADPKSARFDVTHVMGIYQHADVLTKPITVKVIKELIPMIFG